MTTSPFLSVVIPTYNRLPQLRQCLDALYRQVYPLSDCEIIVVDNGSTDDTGHFLAEMKPPSGVTLLTLREPKRGPAAARNTGIRHARGHVVLITGDDIIAAPDLLEQHATWHRRSPDERVVVLGLTTWTPDKPITPFMRWLENGGPQYKFWAIADRQNVFYGHFYTSNASAKRSFLLASGLFDEDFPYASHEDTELAFRMAQRGMRMVYNERAVGYHDHYTSLKDALRRMEKVGETEGLYRLKVCDEAPGAGLVRPASSESLLRRAGGQLKFSLWLLVGRAAERWAILPGVYSYLLERAHIAGLRRWTMQYATASEQKRRKRPSP
ncbi:MAG: glycosyltransferase family 2 protein [Chloroflexi bacterium]|nr:glycosyltransferase family 2 protein [Chloroflexota bacterium]